MTNKLFGFQICSTGIIKLNSQVVLKIKQIKNFLNKNYSYNFKSITDFFYPKNTFFQNL